MRLVDVGQDVWIGDYLACNEHADTFQYLIHIYRESDLRSGKACNACTGTGRGLRVQWREGEQVASMSISWRTLISYVAQPGRLLVHCRMGECRSANIALIAKVARGCEVWQGIADLYERTWQQGYSPVLIPEQIRSVLGALCP